MCKIWHKKVVKHMFLCAILPVLFLISSIFLLPNVARAVSLELSPSNYTVPVGSTFDVKVLLNTYGETVNTLDVRLTFPADILQVVSPTSGKSIIGIWMSPPRFDNQTGEVLFQGGIPGGINVNGGLISTITFRARGTGTAYLRFLDGSKVLLHDGMGTNALHHSHGASYQLVLPPPQGPTVISETHPNPDEWYSNSEVLLSWESQSPVSGYSFVLNDIPVFTPDNTVNSTENRVVFKNLDSGIYYFHIKSLGVNGLWGGVTHLPIRIDTEPPASFPVEIKPSARTLSDTIFTYFSTTDRHSGIDRYEYKIIPLNINPTNQAEAFFEAFFIEASSPEVINLDVGRYDILVRAYDRAGNFQESTARVKIVTPLTLYALNSWTFLGIIFLIIILGIILWRTYKWYKKLENIHAVKCLPEDLENQIQELKNYRSKYGALIIFAGILSGLLFTGQVVSAQTPMLISPPLITTISQNISNEDIFYVGGKTEEVNIDVIVYLQNLGTGETFNFITPSDSKGDWFYRHSTFLSSGEYLVWTQATTGELTSPPGPQRTITVQRTAIQFGANRFSFETLYMVIITFLLIILAGMFIYLVKLSIYGRRKHSQLMKEIKEAEESVKRGFAVLKRDLEAELEIIHKAKLNKELSLELKQKEEQLRKDVAEIENYIGKEIWDIEKYA